MGHPERSVVKKVVYQTKEVTKIIIKAAVAVGILGVMGKFLSPKIERRIKEALSPH